MSSHTTSDHINAKLFDNIERLKANGSNWDIWKTQTMLVLEHRNLMEYINGTMPRPLPLQSSPAGKQVTGPSRGTDPSITNLAEIQDWDMKNHEA